MWELKEVERASNWQSESLNFAQIRGVTLPPFWSKWDDKPGMHRKSLTHYITTSAEELSAIWGCLTKHNFFLQPGSGLCVSTIQLDKLLAPPSQSHWQRAGRSFTCTPVGLNPGPFWRSQGPRIGYTSEPSPMGWVVYWVIWCNKLVATASVEHNRASNGCCCTHFFCCIVCQWWCSVQFSLDWLVVGLIVAAITRLDSLSSLPCSALQ